MSLPEHPDKPPIPLSRLGSIEALFREHYAFVCNVVYKYVADRAKTEDIAQELFAELWTKRDVIQIHSSVSAYLRRMAISRSLNYIRDTKKYNWDELDMTSEPVRETHYQAATALQHLEEDELRRQLEHAIDRLPEKCRIVFMMSRYDELSYLEISQQLNISVKTVENQIGKALKLLRLALVEHRG